MALPDNLVLGKVSIARRDPATQRASLAVLTDARACVQEQADGAQGPMPGNENGADATGDVPVYSIFVDGWDINNADGTTPYFHKAGDLVAFTADADKPWARIYEGEYRQIVQSAPLAGLGMDYSELICIRLTTVPAVLTTIGPVPIPAGSDAHFHFEQLTPASVWIITHNLGKEPSVTIVDSGGNEVEGDVAHISLHQVRVTFSAPFAGEAYLN